ncbi:MAG TPA: tetratricopeptide repeat protein [Lacunisphaera sp.]|nr:tetratricopeptide repeat protein [Lacunisphaera sp.]
MKTLARPLLLVVCLAAGWLAAQVASPAPLVTSAAAAQVVPGNWTVAETRADLALQTGFPSTAATIYRDLLADKNLPPGTRQRVTLGLVTALMDGGDLGAAETALQSSEGPRGSAYQLRAGLLAFALRRFPQARATLAGIKEEELSEADRGWWYFLRASVVAAEPNIPVADELFERAKQVAVSDLQRTRFTLGQEQVKLLTGQVNDAQLATLRGNMERFQGQRLGYDSARYYATALAAAGRAPEAQAVLERQLASIPGPERNVADQIRLMLGLIAGESSAAGRQAFRQLLRDGQKPETQRLALHLLARGAKTTAEREQLRRDLGELISAPAYPISEDLLLVRAQLALADKAYAPAEEDARGLLERFPGSELREKALRVRLAVAWDLKRFRTAADVIVQLRVVLPPGRARAELGVLQAEAFFRAEDYRNAADAYEAALGENPPAATPGILLFQRVLAEIRADRLDVAAKQLDETTSDARFDPVNRWQAEWNLIKVMQARGQNQAASARVERLLASNAEGVARELRIQLLWLRAKLSYDNGQPEAALRQADELLGSLTRDLDAQLLTNVASMAQLLKAQALLTLGRDADGLAVLEKLRSEFRATEAAEYSYLVQASHQTQTGDLAGAQRVLIDFVDPKGYPHSQYAPLALYQAALILERQGLDRQLQEAYKLLEQIVEKYPGDALVFRARMKQGDLLRKLNDFPAARRIYEYLVNNYAGHPDELLAHLALADSLFAQGANSVVNYESASAIFERLRDLPSAPVDLRVEAGFMWGYALAKRGQAAKAQTAFWSVVQGFLLDADQAARLGVKGRYWLSRSLLELGQIHEDAGRLDEAQRAYQLIVENKLSGSALAQSKLARFRPAPASSP